MTEIGALVAYLHYNQGIAQKQGKRMNIRPTALKRYWYLSRNDNDFREDLSCIARSMPGAAVTRVNAPLGIKRIKERYF